jgi:putative tricarboxylic transport membrane protein
MPQPLHWWPRITGEQGRPNVAAIPSPPFDERVKGEEMSSPSLGSTPGSGSRFSGAAVGFGVLLIAIAVLGYLAPTFGIPYGLHFAASCAMGIAGLALILPSFIPFKGLQDYAGGMFLIVIAVVGIAGTLNLNFKTTTGVGPGMMPRATGLIIVAFGLIMVINGLFSKGEGLTRWSIRSIIFVLGSALVFGWTIRPLGLIIAGPLAVIISAFADRDTKWLEVIIFAFVMTAACIALFSYGLKLPIPIWPTQLPFVPGFATIKF